ncbi:MAG: VOC family protein [Thermoplasmata archaeon]|nr:VOC family protein [Thermoplasmata archaeon]
MDGKISQVSLVVTNKERSLTFFTEKAGFEKKTDLTGPGGYRYVTVGLKGHELELALFEVGSATDPTQKGWSKKWAPGKTPPIVLLVPDCRKTHKELSERGVEFPQPHEDHPWGTVATFKDLDGNHFSISQLRGGWAKT